MAHDMEALRNRLKKIKEAKAARGNGDAFWKPKEGKTTIRIVPRKDAPDKTLRTDFLYHYIGGKGYRSPASSGGRDPIIEFAESLRRENTEESIKAAKEFTPKSRFVVPIVVRGEEEKGVRLWSFTQAVYEQILEFVTDPDIGDISDLREGRDIVVTYVPKEKSDTRFPKTQLLYKPSKTPLASDVATIKEWMSNQPEIDKIFPEQTYDGLKDVLDKYLHPEDDDAALKVYSEPVTSGTTTSAADPLAELDNLFS